MKTRNITTVAAIAAACFAASSADAGTPAFRTSKPVTEIVSESCITGDIGVDVVSEYIRHGIVLENQGFIIQPYADLHFRLYKGAGPVDSITADIGIWNSFQDRKSFAGPGSTTSNWFEFDFYAGVTFKVDNLSISPRFKIYESPNDAIVNIYTLGLTLAYDDRNLLGDFALHPHVSAEFSGIFDNRGSTGNSNHSGGEQYYEIGIAPRHSYGDLTLTIPITVGFGANDFYEGNRTFGFFSAGIDAAYALNFVPQCLGVWTVHAGAAYYRLGEGAARVAPAQADFRAFAIDGDRDHLRGDKNQWVFGGGLKVAF